MRLVVSDILALTTSQMFREETTDAFALDFRQEVQLVNELSLRTKFVNVTRAKSAEIVINQLCSTPAAYLFTAIGQFASSFLNLAV